MDKQTYVTIERKMLQCMNDGAHDKEHVYRVLYYVVDIAKDYAVDMDVLIASSLLHDIGRDAQFKDHNVDHALYGADMAYDYILTLGWGRDKAEQIKSCIRSHRYRRDCEPESIEAKILFDADKLDVCGVVGIARTLAYKGIVAEPLYTIDVHGGVNDGIDGIAPSFFQEYHYKLKNIYDHFYTDRARTIAEGRKASAQYIYENMLAEVQENYRIGKKALTELIDA